MKQHAAVVVAVVAEWPMQQKEVKKRRPWLQPSAPPLLEKPLPALRGYATWLPELCSCVKQAPLPLASLTWKGKTKHTEWQIDAQETETDVSAIAGNAARTRHEPRFASCHWRW
jgi:hypothetical protein